MYSLSTGESHYPEWMVEAVDKTIKDNADKVEQIKMKPWNLGWLVGHVLSKTGGRANPDDVRILLRERLRSAEDVAEDEYLKGIMERIKT
jgi:Asp-tRNA(Asn)/Glu-tRNA(Gln) amidotransferase B subunit